MIKVVRREGVEEEGDLIKVVRREGVKEYVGLILILLQLYKPQKHFYLLLYSFPPYYFNQISFLLYSFPPYYLIKSPYCSKKLHSLFPPNILNR